ncbi:MAG TPA: hypothetical protein VFD03_06205 [Clostridia bacterium]|nr:hypothetical protein [Clostridia bacterium]
MNANKSILIKGIQNLIEDYKEAVDNSVLMDVKEMRQQQASSTWRTMRSMRVQRIFRDSSRTSDR